MASENHGAVVRSIDRVFNHESATGLTEGQLLCQFATWGDEAAFEALITRHGPMVLGVCRRLLYDPRDVEDAFQATFLVLLRRAGSLGDSDPLSPWLHGVAYRVAARIRARSARRPGEERKAARSETVESSSDIERHELRGILDEEIGRLPEKYRRPVVLCYLEGQTHEQAARRLRCTEGSVRGRLDRAREKLKGRLTRRGVAPSAGLIASALAGDMASAAVPPSWIAGTIATVGRAATARAVSTTVLELADGVFRAMILTQLKFAASFAAVAAVILAVGAVLTMSLARSVAQDPGRATVAKETGATMTGRVLDREGRPIAGARVARGSDRAKAPFSETTTDAQGRFALRDIPRGELILTVQAKGHAPDLKKLEIGREGHQPVEFRLGLGRTIRGRIIDVHDKPIAGAPVAVDAWRGHHSLTWSTETDAEGRFRWDEAPDDMVLIDVGSLGYYPSKRFWRMSPDPDEKTLTMRRALHIRGAVTDAETGRTVKPFTVIPGYDWGNGQPPSWEYDQARSHSGGAYDITLSTIYPLRVIRIEADGYLPTVSRGFKDDEGETYFNVKLRRGAWTEGVVRLPDRSPLAGADVVLVTPSQPANFRNGVPQSPEDHRILKTGADGRFAFPEQEPPYTIVVLHDRGFAQRTIVAKPGLEFDLTVTFWGRVEGTLRIGSRPGAGEPVSITYEQQDDTLKPIPWWGGAATTDAEGRFAFERVKPGPVIVARTIPVQTTQAVTTMYSGSSALIDVAPGQTAHTVLGGKGRPVVGKVTAPAEIAGRIDWNQGINSLIRKESEVQPGLKKLPRSAPQPQGVALGRDGSFRIEDVEAGTYDLLIVVDEPPRDPQGPPSNKALATARREVIVPKMPGGRGDEPLDLGTIPLEPVKKP